MSDKFFEALDRLNKESPAVRGEFEAPSDCEHNWEPVSMVFETQLLDDYGRVVVRQPDIDFAKTFFICQLCASHTYMTTQWIGYRLYGSQDANPDKEAPNHRKAWKLDE